ncbi:MAG: CinA family protein [Firmicutes bacterium]|nr:CinA family protein [Bacillota bacterium]
MPFYDDPIDELALRLGEKLRSRGLTISLAESCTGGWLSAAVTSAAGSSDYFFGSLVTYSNQAKIGLLGVDPLTLERQGAVSPDTAREMADNVRARCGTDIGLSITGIAGPSGGSPEKPVGLVYLGISAKDSILVRRELFQGSRREIRRSSVKTALCWLIELVDGW